MERTVGTALIFRQRICVRRFGVPDRPTNKNVVSTEIVARAIGLYFRLNVSPREVGEL